MGKEPETILKPHKFQNGMFKASEFKGGRSEWASSEQDLIKYFAAWLVHPNEQSR